MAILINMDFNNMISCILNYFFVQTIVYVNIINPKIIDPPAKAGGNSNRVSLFKDKLALSTINKIQYYKSKFFQKNNLYQSNKLPEAELPPALAGERK